MVIIDLAFAVRSLDSLPVDHGYPLYAALSNQLPQLHQAEHIAVHPLRGRQIGDRRMVLTPGGRLTFRLPVEAIPELLPLAGATLSVCGASLLVGVPEVRALIAAPRLRSRMVTIKLKEAGEPGLRLSEENFAAALRRQLNSLGVQESIEPEIGRRRTLRVKDKVIVGYEVLFRDLSTEDSLRIQAMGLGGRKHMGCGVFVPTTRA